MIFLRETNNYSSKILARKLRITADLYRAIEEGKVLITHEQAKQLGAVYNVNPLYFHAASRQLDISLTNKTIIRILKFKIDSLQEGLNRIASTLNAQQ